MSNRSLLKTLGFLAGLVIVSVLARIIITGGYSTVRLSSAPSSLAGPVSIGIGQASSSKLPQVGKDYQIKNVRYFDNNDWIVVRILPLKNNADPAFMVLKKINGVYQAVMGPAGQFNSSYFYVLPNDVYQYLAQQGVFNG